VIDDARSRDQVLALLFVDLDGFKIVNDTWGHESGDVVLKETAARMTRTVRNNDICFRMGGDEFVIILSTINDRMHSCLVSRRLISAISEPIVLPSGNQAKVGASIGIATFPADGSEIEELLHRADEAMVHGEEARQEQLSTSPLMRAPMITEQAIVDQLTACVAERVTLVVRENLSGIVQQEVSAALAKALAEASSIAL